ncbi:hypothetical protein H6P81_001436 [Aristolochia fimbriata]|uniref:Pentatricopeptide repeat-containing protein n=1 Tax=Aristolochia fimbriata TaxID=158543 RepID=A0AAV7F7H8_ARIFI|nr:hypothetical protein H6P81_001436 [Aristolochia fimbriata]
MSGFLLVALSRTMRRSATVTISGQSIVLRFYYQSTQSRSFSLWLRTCSFASLPEILNPEAESSYPLPQLFSVLSSRGWRKDPLLKKLAPALTPLHVSKLCSLPLDPKVVLDFFHWIAGRPGFRHDPHTHLSLLNLLITAKFFSFAEKIRISMIKCCTSEGEVLFVLEELRRINHGEGENKFTLTLRSYNTILMSLARFMKIDLMKEVYGDILEDKLKPNIYTFNTMINAHCKGGDIVEAKRYMNYILQHGLVPDTHTYTSLILGYCRASDLDGCKPDAQVYTSFIRAYCREGKFAEVENLMLKMKLDGVQPDVVTYVTLMDGYGSSGLKDLAFDVFKHMFLAGCKPDYHAYAVMLKHIFREKIVKDTESSAVFDVWKTLTIDNAFNFLEQMVSHGCSPCVDSFEALIWGFCKEDRLEDAQNLVQHMSHLGIPPDEDIYTNLVNCCCKLGMYLDALKLVERMVETGHLPRLESYKLLINAFSDQKQYDNAKNAFNGLLGCEYNYDEVAWVVLIDGLLRSGHVDMCSVLLDIMEGKGCQLSSQTYDLLIKELPVE